MKKNKIILIVGGVAIAGAVAYYFIEKSKNKPTSNLTDIPQIFMQLYKYGGWIGKPSDTDTHGFTVDDLPYLNTWLDAAKSRKGTFVFEGKTYLTVGGKLK